MAWFLSGHPVLDELFLIVQSGAGWRDSGVIHYGSGTWLYSSDTKGRKVSLDDYRGKIIYINTWVSWSETCKQEILALEEVYQLYKDREDIVFLSVVSANDKKYGNARPADGSEEEILALAEEYGVSYPILFDTEDNFMEAYMVSDFPTQIFITSDGVLAMYIADDLTAEALIEILESAY